MSSPRLFVLSSVKSALRRTARTGLMFLLRLRSRPLSLNAAPLIIIAPHPDDATLGCGGLIFKRRLAGEPVHVVYLTDGSASHLGHPTLTPSRLAEQRQEEARLAQFRLGTDSAGLHFLHLPDGRLPSLSPSEHATALTALTTLIGTINPGALLLPSRRDGSSEHEAAFLLIRAALSQSACQPRLLEYPVWARWSPRFLAPLLFSGARSHRFTFRDYGPFKRAALDTYVSQFQPTAPWTQPVLPAGFAQAFDAEVEYFFEYLE